jgi:hypothetical protein
MSEVAAFLATCLPADVPILSPEASAKGDPPIAFFVQDTIFRNPPGQLFFICNLAARDSFICQIFLRSFICLS